MAWQWPAAAQQARLNEPGTKSDLVVLAERFQDTFCSTAGSAAAEFNLSEAAEQLTVSRRRLYDIVNVLEPLQMVARTGKLTYQWKGVGHLPQLMNTLHDKAMAGCAQPHSAAGHLPGSCWVLTLRFVQQLLLDDSALPLTTIAERLEQLSSAAAAAAAGSSVAEPSSSTRAAGASGRGSTAERRLYDIGSVLSTFALCAKTLQGGSGPRHRQPVYQWTYPWHELLAVAGTAPTGNAAAAAAVAAAPATAAAGTACGASGAAAAAAPAAGEASACCGGDTVSEEAAAAAGVLCCLGGLNPAELEEAVTSTLAAVGAGDQAAPASTSCGCGASCRCCSGEGCCRPGAGGGGPPVAEAVQQRLQLVDTLLQLTQSCVIQSVGTGCCSAVLQQARSLVQNAQSSQACEVSTSGAGNSGSGGEAFSQELQRLMQQLQQQQQQFAPGTTTVAAAGPQQQQQEQPAPMVPPPEQAPQLLPEEQGMEAGPGGSRPGVPADAWCVSGVEPEGLGDLRINSGNSNEMNNAERLAALQQLPEDCPTPGHPECSSAMEWAPLEEEVGLEPPSKRRMRQPGPPGGYEV